MAAEVITHTYIGYFADAGAEDSPANRLVWEVVAVKSVQDDDWIILPELEAIMGAWCYAVASDVHTPQACEVDTTDTTKIILTNGSASDLRIMVWGTKAAE